MTEHEALLARVDALEAEIGEIRARTAVLEERAGKLRADERARSRTKKPRRGARGKSRLSPQAKQQAVEIKALEKSRDAVFAATLKMLWVAPIVAAVAYAFS
jgi:hypothetical protein